MRLRFYPLVYTMKSQLSALLKILLARTEKVFPRAQKLESPETSSCKPLHHSPMCVVYAFIVMRESGLNVFSFGHPHMFRFS